MAIEWATERRKVADLRDYPKNPRIFTEKGMADLKASLKSLGYIDPIAINLDGTIIGGHARKAVLRDLGLHEIDVRVPDRLLTEKEVDEAIIRLNHNTAGEWDFKMLEDAFSREDLIGWGFEKAEFNAFAQQTLFEDIDAVEEEPEVAVSEVGDIWVLGDHRLLCGSATDSHAVKEFLAGGGAT